MVATRAHPPDAIADSARRSRTSSVRGPSRTHRLLRRDVRRPRRRRRRGSSCRSPEAMRYILTAPGELGFARAYVAGELDVEGDIFDALALPRPPPQGPAPPVAMARARAARRARWAPASAGTRSKKRACTVAGTRRRQRRGRDRVPLRRLERVLPRSILGPSMTYSCAVWSSPDVDARRRAGRQVRPHLPQARVAAGHAAARRRLRMGRHGDARGAPLRRQAVGVTLSRNQAEYATEAVRERRSRRRRDPRAGLPRCRRPLRRDQLDRHVRARGAGAARRVLHAPATSCSCPAAAC